MRHIYECPLRWADLDPLNHVNNVRYMDYLQDARVDFIRTVAPGLRADADAQAAEALVVVSHDITYRAPMPLRASVDVECWVSEVRAASFTISYEIVAERAGERTVFATASTVLAPFVFAEERPRRLTSDERALLRSLVEGEETVEPIGPTTPHISAEGAYDLAVRFSDIDAYGHVNNVMYFEYFQEARIAFMSRMKKQLSTPDPVNVVIARTQLEYLVPVLHRRENYRVNSWLSKVGGRSMVVESQLVDDTGESPVVHARAKVSLVFFDAATQRSAAPSEELHALVRRYLAVDAS